MSLLLAYTFNDNNPSSFADFSGNKQAGSGTIGGIVAGQNYGYAADFSATNNHITVTPSNFSGASALTVFASIYFSSLPVAPGVAYIINQSGSFNVYVNSSGNIIFNCWNVALGSYVTLTSAATLSASAWCTICCVADGSNMYIYINGIQDANTTANAGISINNNAVYIGNDTAVDTSNTFSGYIDTIEVRSAAASVTDAVNLNSSPGGTELTNVYHNFATGDILIDETNAYKAVVTWVADNSNFYLYPLTAFPANFMKIGNVCQTARQYFMRTSLDFDGNGNGQISIVYPIAGFADYSSPANSITFDYTGINGATNLIANMRAITSLRI